jgi:hypothetical protein
MNNGVQPQPLRTISEYTLAQKPSVYRTVRSQNPITESSSHLTVYPGARFQKSVRHRISIAHWNTPADKQVPHGTLAACNAAGNCNSHCVNQEKWSKLALRDLFDRYAKPSQAA